MPNDGLNSRQYGHSGYAEGQQRPEAARPRGPRDWPTTPDVEALEDLDSHFTPPRPGAVLGVTTEPWRRVASLGIIIGPIVAILGLIVRAIIGPGPLIYGLLLFAAILFIVTLISLFAKLPNGATRHDGDDGAVV